MQDEYSQESVVDRLLTERLVSLGVLARQIGVHPSTIARWITRGVDGIQLEAVRAGATWRSSERALARFMRQRAAAAGVQELPSSNSAHEAAVRRLESRGIAMT